MRGVTVINIEQWTDGTFSLSRTAQNSARTAKFDSKFGQGACGAYRAMRDARLEFF